MATTGAQLQSAAAEERAVRELVAWLRARRLNLTEAGESVRWLSYLLDPAPPAAGASRSHSATAAAVLLWCCRCRQPHRPLGGDGLGNSGSQHSQVRSHHITIHNFMS